MEKYEARCGYLRKPEMRGKTCIFFSDREKRTFLFRHKDCFTFISSSLTLPSSTPSFTHTFFYLTFLSFSFYLPKCPICLPPCLKKGKQGLFFFFFFFIKYYFILLFFYQLCFSAMSGFVFYKKRTLRQIPVPPTQSSGVIAVCCEMPQFLQLLDLRGQRLRLIKYQSTKGQIRIGVKHLINGNSLWHSRLNDPPPLQG